MPPSGQADSRLQRLCRALLQSRRLRGAEAGHRRRAHANQRVTTMQSLAISTLTICGIEELPAHSLRRVSHVLSLLDPGLPEIDTFGTYGEHHRVTLRFHDILGPSQGMTPPQPGHVEQILHFGEALREGAGERVEGHLLVHCHMGISRSTAAMLMLMAQNDPDASEDELFARLRTVRPAGLAEFGDDRLRRRAARTWWAPHGRAAPPLRPPAQGPAAIHRLDDAAGPRARARNGGVSGCRFSLRYSAVIPAGAAARLVQDDAWFVSELPRLSSAAAASAAAPAPAAAHR